MYFHAIKILLFDFDFDQFLNLIISFRSLYQYATTYMYISLSFIIYTLLNIL